MGFPCDWQTKKQKVSQRGQYLLETGQWSDCKFIVGREPHQQVLEGHKVFLAMSSPVFEAMFYGGMAEKSDPIPIRDVQPEAFKALLEYIYTDRVDLGSFELACELCYCAKKYMLPFLVEECTKFLWSDLSPKKASRAYEFAKLFEEPVLMEKCLQIICTKTLDVFKESSWDEIELGTLLTVFEQNELLISSEIELFTALERWSKAECVRKSLDPLDKKSQRSVIGNSLTKIRFLTLTPQEFAEGPGRSSLLTKEEAFAILMNISSSNSEISMPEGFSTNTQKRYNTKIHQKTVPIIEWTAKRLSNLEELYPKCTTPYKVDSPFFSFNFPTTSMGRSTLVPLTDDLDHRTNSLRSGPSSNLASGELPSTIIASHTVFDRDGVKYYCTRNVLTPLDCVNTSVLDCSVTFTVDKNICVLGVQVPTQIQLANQGSMFPMDSSYTEVLYAHLLDSDGSRLTYTHFTTKVDSGTLVEITFNRPVYIQKNKVYRVGVVFNKVGRYPMGICSQSMNCDTVLFTFGVGNVDNNTRDGLIRSIVFTYH